MRRHTLATEQGRAADRDFHLAILAATRNEALQALGAGIGAAVNWTTQFKQRLRALPRNPIPDHVRVYDAIAAGDATAAPPGDARARGPGPRGHERAAGRRRLIRAAQSASGGRAPVGLAPQSA